jgi:quinol monooxygenase YgiN
MDKMIFVSMVIRANPGTRDQLAEAMAAMMTDTRKEPGAVVYTYAADLADPDIFHLTEIWQSEAEMEAHIDAVHSRRFVQTLGGMATFVSVKAYSSTGTAKHRIRAPS